MSYVNINLIKMRESKKFVEEFSKTKDLSSTPLSNYYPLNKSILTLFSLCFHDELSDISIMIIMHPYYRVINTTNDRIKRI